MKENPHEHCARDASHGLRDDAVSRVATRALTVLTTRLGASCLWRARLTPRRKIAHLSRMRWTDSQMCYAENGVRRESPACFQRGVHLTTRLRGAVMADLDSTTPATPATPVKRGRKTTRKAAAKKAATKRGRKTTRKAAAKKTGGRKKTARKATRKTGAKKTARKKTARKAAAKKGGRKKTARKAAAKKGGRKKTARKAGGRKKTARKATRKAAAKKPATKRSVRKKK
jgi:hypothetical protein